MYLLRHALAITLFCLLAVPLILTYTIEVAVRAALGSTSLDLWTDNLADWFGDLLHSLDPDGSW